MNCICCEGAGPLALPLREGLARLLRVHRVQRTALLSGVGQTRAGGPGWGPDMALAFRRE